MRRAVVLLALIASCSSSHQATTDASGQAGGDASGSGSGSGGQPDAPGAAARTVFVIPMENEPSSAIYGNTTSAPYINGLLATGAHATMFKDELTTLPSEPHYIYMEAGTNAFPDPITFITDADPSATHSTSSTDHLAAQLEAAHLSWTSYQEDIDAGTCPIGPIGFYRPKHDPVVFFQDIVGNPPSATAPICIAHHKPYSQLAADLAGEMPRLVFITPNLCHDMHGDVGCPQGTNVAANIQAGDTWLASELPRILSYAQAHDSLVFLTWDEGDSSNLIPFIALGPHVKAGYTSTVLYNHGSQLKTIEKLLGLPLLSTVVTRNDFADMFAPGTLP